MRPQAHVAASLALWGCSRAALWEAPVCVLCGNLPDLDRNIAKAAGLERRDHHRWVSHSFAGWFPVSAAALTLARGSRRAGTVRRGVGCVWVHLLLDTYADGLAWLWPLSVEKIGLFQGPPSRLDRGWRTPAPLHSRLGRAEAAMWGLFAAGAARRVLRRP